MAIQINNVNVIDDSRNISAGIVTVGTGNSQATINGNTGIASIGIGITAEGSSGDLTISGTLTAAGISVPPSVVSFSPADGATDVDTDVNISITFDQYITGLATDKYIRIRSGSATGTVLETITANAGNVSVSGATVTINPSTNYPTSTTMYPVIDEGAFFGVYDSPSQEINTYNFTSYAIPEEGDLFQGGYVMCKTASVLWIVAPPAAQFNTNYSNRTTANSCAQTVTGYSGWFYPTVSQLQNPGYVCRANWGNTFGSIWGTAQGQYNVVYSWGNPGGEATSHTGFRAVSFRTVSY